MIRSTATFDGFARATFFALAPAAAAGGAMALPALISLTALASGRLPPLRRWARQPGFWLIVGLAVWAAISCAWGPPSGPGQALRLIALLVFGAMFAAAAARAPAARLTLAAAIAAFAVLAALLAVEAALGLPLTRAIEPDAMIPTRNPSRGAVVLLALSWACAGALAHWRRPIAAALALFVSGALSLQFGQTANAVGFALGLGAFAAALRWPKLALLTTSGGLAAWMLLAPFATPLLTARAPVDTMPYSYASRVAIWDYTSARIREAPWSGRGFDASRIVTDRVAVAGGTIRGIPLHPHSTSLQVWYEMGLIGAALAALALAWGGAKLAQGAARDGRIASAAAAATMASLGVIANVSYGAWQEWWISTLFVAASVNAALRAARA